MTVKNTLAYYDKAKNMAVRSFIFHAPVVAADDDD
jgi:hypothetical protein